MRRARRPRPGHPFFAGAPLLIAHRGGAKLAPENTMPAFRQAVDDWDADMLEMDVRPTRDGRVVVIHDETVDRTTNGHGPIAGMTWDEARSLDAAYRFRDPNGEHSLRGAGVRLPLFAEVLEAFPDMRIIVEPKTAEVAGPLVREVRAARAEERVLVGAEFEATRGGARGYRGPWGASRKQATRFWILHHIGLAGRCYVPAADGFQLPEWSGRFRAVTPRLIAAAHAANMPVYVWTVDDPGDMRRLLRWGADGIMTDRPDVLAGVLGDMAGRPAPRGAKTVA
ncbi:MAG: glycerophosphodiester phosphodiesterase [Gemmatimonadetes bacterium]|nr:glycerophosphodiester phosphodiesterase [Gemmatimonadota bacterium]MYC90194.1 glycerophosphodiester phosphodiesterase [Gemmatimonadota bacterium]MYG34354.1 glycerophosphodiester phosphodiesterase [Gemmatimonadota bacterium]